MSDADIQHQAQPAESARQWLRSRWVAIRDVMGMEILSAPLFCLPICCRLAEPIAADRIKDAEVWVMPPGNPFYVPPGFYDELDE